MVVVVDIVGDDGITGTETCFSATSGVGETITHNNVNMPTTRRVMQPTFANPLHETKSPLSLIFRSGSCRKSSGSGPVNDAHALGSAGNAYYTLY